MKVSEWKKLLEFYPDDYQIDGRDLVVMDAGNIVLGPVGNGIIVHEPFVPPAIRQLLADKGGIRLDVACGRDKQRGFVGMDIRPLPGVDIVHDLERFPWPLPDRCCTMMLMSHIVEHIKPWVIVQVFDEMWRVMQPEGQLLIATPYWTSAGAAQDPTHIHCWNENTIRYFCKAQRYSDGSAREFEPEQSLYHNFYAPRPWVLESCEWRNDGNLEIRIAKLDEDPPDE